MTEHVGDAQGNGRPGHLAGRRHDMVHRNTGGQAVPPFRYEHDKAAPAPVTLELAQRPEFCPP